MLSILVADDDAIFRTGLREVLEQHHGWYVCAEAATDAEAVEKASTLQPNVAILDLRMPERGGLEASRRIREACPRTGVLVLTGFPSEQLLPAVVTSGAHGLVPKGGDGAEVVAAVDALEHHRTWFRGGCAGEPPQSDGGPAPRRTRWLTPRELEVVRLLAEGHTSGRVGAVLGISVKTVETHRAKIMRKLELGSVVGLVRYALRHQLIEP